MRKASMVLVVILITAGLVYGQQVPQQPTTVKKVVDGLLLIEQFDKDGKVIGARVFSLADLQSILKQSQSQIADIQDSISKLQPIGQ